MPNVWWYEKRQCWCADVPDRETSGKRKRLYLGQDKEAALSQLHRYLAEFHANAPTRRSQHQRLSLAALTARFLNWTKTNLSADTHYLYTLELRPFVQKHGARAAEDITPSDVEEQKSAIRKRGVKARTVNLFVQVIKRTYNWGVEQRLISDNPIKNVRRVPRDPPTDRSLEASDIEQFLERAHESEPLGDICEVLLHTGMRVGEALNLKWGDIDVRQRMARIFNHKTAHRGDQRPRTIPLNDRVIKILKNQSKTGKVVFIGEGGQPLTYSALKCRKGRLEEKYSEMPHVTFHQFRHTFATRLARNGVPERVAQEILGHASTLMTRHYTTTSAQEMLDAVQGSDG